MHASCIAGNQCIGKRVFRYLSSRQFNLRRKFISSSFAADEVPHCFQTTRDKYGRHRRVTQGLLAEYRKESNVALSKIDNKLRQRLRIDRHVLVKEISAASSRGTLGPDTAEVGPAGLFKYYFEDSSAGIRTYRRMANVGPASDNKLSEQQHQFVMRLNFQTERPGPISISADEACVARVTVSSLTGSSRIIIYHIDSGAEHQLHSEVGRPNDVEFGPCFYEGGDGEKKYYLYFTTSNIMGRPDSVYRLVWSSCNGFDLQNGPNMVFHDADEANFVGVTRSKGNRWMIFQSTSGSSNEVHLLGGESDDPVLVRAREENVMYYVECGGISGDIFVLAYRFGGSRKRDGCLLGTEMAIFQSNVLALPIEGPFENRLEGCLDETHFIEEMDLFENHIALYERSSVDGRQRIRTFERRGKSDNNTIVAIPDCFEGCGNIRKGGNSQYQTSTMAYRIDTPVEPAITYEYNMVEDSPVQKEGRELRNDIHYQKLMVTGTDGKEIPLTIVGKVKGSPEEVGSSDLFGVQRPTVLVAYGSYGEENSMNYDPTIVPLIDRGFIVGYAHTRGGGELGRSWYAEGRGSNKERAIEDYLVCADALIGELGVAGKDQLAAKAFSAGGVIAAAAANLRPELFSAISLMNPFLDVSGTMVDASLPLTEHEFDEWGDPLRDKKDALAIQGYCPFANLQIKDYPPTLLVTAIDDVQVPYWHSTAYGAKRKEIIMEMRKRGKICNRDNILLHVEAQGGHNFHGRRLDVASVECAFLLGELASINK